MSFLAEQIKKGKEIFSNNMIVFENYFFMTSLQVFSVLIGLLLYPYLIRVLGPDSYGLYVLSLSVSSFFLIVVSCGFSWLALKDISQNKSNPAVKSKVLSTVFTAKLMLSVLVFGVFFVFTLIFPFFTKNKFILLLCLLQVIVSDILFPTWYFQGIQKMKIVTYIQLFFRILTIPFIFILIKNPNDVGIYAAIVAGSLLLSGLGSMIYLIKKEGVILRLISINTVIKYIKNALPFFWTEAVGVAKQESITLIIGAFMGLHDVALYDLANKIVSIPRIITNKINGAIFPKLIQNPQPSTIKKILGIESLIGTGIIALIAAFGYWMVLILGGEQMILAYPIAVILSITILSSLLVGGINNFVFIPSEKYYYVAYSQLVGLLSFLILSLPFLALWNSIFVVVIAMGLSGIFEFLYCNYRIRKRNLLKS